MANFHRWEKDPFFSAAEEVQESADRMESTYRTWIHANLDASSNLNSEEVLRDLRTSLGTTKWQLDEFARAVRSSYSGSLNSDARDRHREFISAMEDQVSKVENSIQESAHSEGKASHSWVRLDEGERNELALFLSGSPTFENKPTLCHHDVHKENPKETDTEMGLDSSKNSHHSVKSSSLEVQLEKPHGHRRTASASADIEVWKIAVVDDGYAQTSSIEQPGRPPRKVPSLAGFLNTMESASKMKWPKTGFKKWKVVNSEEAETALLRSPPLPRGINSCYERSKTCLDTCEDCYDKHLYGWYGAIQRQLQRSQYQVQYRRHVKVIFWTVLLLSLIVLVGVHAI